MPYEPKPGQGALFKNNHKTQDNHPGMTGYVIAHRQIKEGEKLNLASWKKEGQSGVFLSLKMSDVRGQEAAPERDERPAPEPRNQDSDFDLDDGPPPF